MPKGIFQRKPITELHRFHLSIAQLGNKNGKGKNLGNKNAFGKTRADKNGNWKGGLRTLAYKEKIAGRKKPDSCEICGAIGQIDFDHDHETSRFRGWICRRCNLVLGMVKDNSTLLIDLSNYLNHALPSDHSDQETS